MIAPYCTLFFIYKTVVHHDIIMKNEFLRHIIATIKYRFDKSVKDSKENFGKFNLGKGCRNPIEIINHMYNVLNSTRIYVEEERFNNELPEKLTLSQ